MKTKVLLLVVVVISLMSIRLSAQVQFFILDESSNYPMFSVCQNTHDSIVIYKPENAGFSRFLETGGDWMNVDSVIITVEDNVNWRWQGVINGDNIDIIFTVNFTSIAPTEPFTDEELYKCPETSMVILGQAEHQPDFTYVWGAGETTQSIQLLIPGMVFVTITGACGEVTDMMEVMNWPSPNPSLGADQVLCGGSTATLDPGTFAAYFWTGGSTDPTLEVTETNSYTVTVADDNGCQGIDEVYVYFTENIGQEILLVTIDTINGNNRIIWQTDNAAYESVVIRREASTDVYEVIGNTMYALGEWTDEVSSVNQTWRYKIEVVDTCGNYSELSPYHQTISTATMPMVGGGYHVVWTPYLIQDGEKGTRSVSNYYIFAVQGLGINWNAEQFAQVTGNVTEYSLPIVDDSMFVVGAELGGTKAGVTGLALSNLVNNPLLAVPHILAEDINIYPNPSTGVFFVEGGDRVEIYNSAGQLVMSKSVDQLTSIEIAGAGLYIVKVYDRTQVIVSNKISIQ